MNETKTYRINEIFYSLQGEGHFTGSPAVFVRFSGCNRACSFCDTDFKDFRMMSASDIIREISKFPALHIVITGGEPAMQIDDALVEAMHQQGKFVQIETNGSLPVPDAIDWVTCSPKDKPWGIKRIDELKVVFTGQDVEEIAEQFPADVEKRLQPCSCANISRTVDYILSHPHWRLSLQTHKFINIQ